MNNTLILSILYMLFVLAYAVWDNKKFRIYLDTEEKLTYEDKELERKANYEIAYAKVYAKESLKITEILTIAACIIVGLSPISGSLLPLEMSWYALHYVGMIIAAAVLVLLTMYISRKFLEKGMYICACITVSVYMALMISIPAFMRTIDMTGEHVGRGDARIPFIVFLVFAIILHTIIFKLNREHRNYVLRKGQREGWRIAAGYNKERGI